MRRNSYIFIFITLAFSSIGQIPSFQWAKSFGGKNYDYGYSTTIDGSGNVYTCGMFADTIDFDPGPGTYTLGTPGSDIFISKLDANGNFIWARGIISTYFSCALSITNDASGNLYFTGFFGGVADFDPGPGIFNLTSVGTYDGFVCKLNPSGNFVWAKQFSGGDVQGNSIVIDPTGFLYTTGNFKGSTDFDPGPSTYTLNSGPNGPDIFVSKIDLSGSFVWAKKIGGGNGTSLEGNAAAIDGFGNIYLSGNFDLTADFDPGPGTYNLTAIGSTDIFVCKLNSSGILLWAKQMGGNNQDACSSLITDPSGNVYSTGTFKNSSDFDPGASIYTLNSFGFSDIFLSKLDASGNFIWAKQIGGVSYAFANSISLDGLGNIFFTGGYDGTVDFDPGLGTFNLTSVSSGGSDLFISKLDAFGNFDFAVSIGGSSFSTTKGYNIKVDLPGNIYTTGYFGDTEDFDPGASIDNITSNGASDAFIVKLNTVNTHVKSSTSFLHNGNVFPNPNNGSFKLQIDSEIRNGELILMNSLGQIIYEQKISRGENDVNTNGLAKGLYNYSLLENKIRISGGKVSLE